MPKYKLKRFAEIAGFSNVFQLTYEELLNEFPLKGKWNKEYFKNNNPIVLELGCGKGEYTTGLAEKHPEKNFIGIDIKGNRLWRGAKTSAEKNFNNVAFIRTQIEQIEHIFGHDEISEIWLTFPDPRPKNSGIKRRLTSPEFLSRYRNILKKNAFIHLKTDDESLFRYTIAVIKKHKYNLIEHTEGLYNSAVCDRAKEIKTFYEKMFLEQNLPITYLCFSIG